MQSGQLRRRFGLFALWRRAKQPRALYKPRPMCYNGRHTRPTGAATSPIDKEALFMDSPRLETTLIQYTPTLWAIDQGMVRAFLILGEEKALLWDTGASACDLPALIRTVTDLPLVVVNSHGDGDHTANNGLFPEVYLHPDDAPLLRRFGPAPDNSILPVEEGQVFALGGRDLEVIAIPGHTPGSICLLDRANRMLFSGDTVQRDSVFLFGSHRQPELFPAALEKLKGMSAAFDTVWPSHGPCPVEPETIDGLLRCYRAAVSGQLQGQPPERPMPGDDSPQLYRLDGCSVLL